MSFSFLFSPYPTGFILSPPSLSLPPYTFFASLVCTKLHDYSHILNFMTHGPVSNSPGRTMIDCQTPIQTIMAGGMVKLHSHSNHCSNQVENSGGLRQEGKEKIPTTRWGVPDPLPWPLASLNICCSLNNGTKAEGGGEENVYACLNPEWLIMPLAHGGTLRYWSH